MKALLALAAIAAIATPALARPRSDVVQIGADRLRIYYRDLDTDSSTGRAALLARVEQAAHRLCLTDTRQAEASCVQSVVADIHRPVLQRALAERSAEVVAAR